MPLFDYSCGSCGEKFEVFVPLQKLDEEVKCPDCGQVLKREMSAPRLIKVN